jgi:phage anti-repressor protein/phage antirepressor YoqD-like protein
MPNINQAFALATLQSTEQFPINLSDIWEGLGYSTKANSVKSFNKCGFSLNLDFILKDERTVHKDSSGFDNTVVSKHILMTADCFKMFCMMAGTEKGKEVRLYFIEAEKELNQIKQQQTIKLPTKIELAQMLIESETARIEAEAKVIELAPKAEVYDKICKTSNKPLSRIINDLNMGRNTGFEKLRSMGILQKTSPLPYQRYVDQGYFEVKCSESGFEACYVTKKGIPFVIQKLESWEQKEATTIQLEIELGLV